MTTKLQLLPPSWLASHKTLRSNLKWMLLFPNNAWKQSGIVFWSDSWSGQIITLQSCPSIAISHFSNNQETVAGEMLKWNTRFLLRQFNLSFIITSLNRSQLLRFITDWYHSCYMIEHCMQDLQIMQTGIKLNSVLFLERFFAEDGLRMKSCNLRLGDWQLFS